MVGKHRKSKYQKAKKTMLFTYFLIEAIVSSIHFITHS